MTDAENDLLMDLILERITNRIQDVGALLGAPLGGMDLPGDDRQRQQEECKQRFQSSLSLGKMAGGARK